MMGKLPTSVQPRADPDAMVQAMIQTPKAAIPAEIKNESALSICVPFQGFLPQDRRAKGARCASVFLTHRKWHDRATGEAWASP
jgi:hypothetical protein